MRVVGLLHLLSHLVKEIAPHLHLYRVWMNRKGGRAIHEENYIVAHVGLGACSGY